MSQRKSLLSRPLDLTYFIYVATHIPITIFLDCQSLYPLHLTPQFLKDFNAYYLGEFKDPLVANARNMPWFKSFMWCEAIFQLPFFFWALRGLYHDTRLTRVGLLTYGTHVATTVIPCLAELAFGTASQATLTSAERYTLIGFYIPYLLIPVTMVVDSYFKVSSMIRSDSSKPKPKQN
ncbi:Transmembrane protein 97 [Umbelopsis sp. WA50703]